MSALATEDMFPVTATDICPVARADISPVTTKEIYPVSTEDGTAEFYDILWEGDDDPERDVHISELVELDSQTHTH